MRVTGGDGGHASPMVHVRRRLRTISRILIWIFRPPASTAPRRRPVRPSSCRRRSRTCGRGRASRPRGGEIDADGQHMIGSGSTVRSMRAPEGSANSSVTHRGVRRFLRNNDTRPATRDHAKCRWPRCRSGFAPPRPAPGTARDAPLRARRDTPSANRGSKSELVFTWQRFAIAPRAACARRDRQVAHCSQPEQRYCRECLVR